jgi:hypothetical protein
LKNAEAKYGTWDLPKNDTKSAVQKKSNPACTSLGCQTDTNAKYTVPAPNPAPLVTYPTGTIDSDIKATQDNLKNAEDKFGPWILPKNETKAAQKSAVKIGKWTPVSKKNAEKSGKKSDPICSSSGWCGPGSGAEKKPEYPVDYKVPNFGVDRDILDSQKNERDAEAKYGIWTPKLKNSTVAAQIASMGPESAKLLPHESVSKSDPICASSGWCGPNIQERKPGPADVVVVYPTNLPLDRDIIDSQSNLDNTEKKLGTWKFPPANSTKALLKADEAIKHVHEAINLG